MVNTARRVGGLRHGGVGQRGAHVVEQRRDGARDTQDMSCVEQVPVAGCATGCPPRAGPGSTQSRLGELEVHRRAGVAEHAVAVGHHLQFGDRKTGRSDRRAEGLGQLCGRRGGQLGASPQDFAEQFLWRIHGETVLSRD
jgi:hypothetical protein